MAGNVSLEGFGSGGASLNFKVLGGTSQPASAKENTIWVNTDQKINGYILSATEPEAPAEGMVWISIGIESGVAFSVTKKNPVMVYPISAKQYISGSWMDKVAKSYQDGAWVDWITYLFNNGDECTERTGGWSGAWTNANGYFHITANGNTTWYPECTANKIDLTNVNTIIIQYEITDVGTGLQYSMRLGTLSAKPGVALSSAPSYVSSVVCSEAENKAVLDVSTLSGEYYVVFTAPSSTSTTKTNVYEVIID